VRVQAVVNTGDGGVCCLELDIAFDTVLTVLFPLPRLM